MLPVPLDDASFSKLARSLARFDPAAAISSAAGLLTVPDFATATVRLEALVNLACLHCHGSRRPTGEDLRRWVNDVLGGHPLAVLEDPLEDVFVSAVATPIGVYRIFEGTWESNDAYLQDALDCLSALDGIPERAELIQQIRALLALSDTVCERRHLARWIVAKKDTPSRWIIPPGIDPAPLRAAVTFTIEDLEALGIQPPDLEPFLLPVSPPAEDEFGAPPLERRPLIWFRRELILASASSVSAAIRARILGWAGAQNVLKELAAALRRHQWGKLSRACIHDGDVGIAEGWMASVPAKNQSLPIDERVVAFDTDKLAHIVLVHDDLVAAARTRIGDHETVPDDQREALAKRVLDVAQALAPLSPGGGLTVMILGGLGRGRTVEAPTSEGPWRIGADSLPNFLTLLRNPEWDLLRLWRMLWHEEVVADAGVLLWNPYGMLTLAGYWEHHAFSLVPKFVPFPPSTPGTIPISPAYVLRPRVDRRREDDIHAVPIDGHGRSVVVRRITARAYFPAMRERPIYAAEGALSTGVLSGVVDAPPVICWVVTDGTGVSGEAREFQYNVWEATLEWLDACLALLRPCLAPGAAPILVELQWQGPAPWSIPDSTDSLPAVSPLTPTSTLDLDHRHVRVSLERGFVLMLARTSNDAERALLRAILEQIPPLFVQKPGAELPNLDMLIERTFGGTDARKLHLFQAQLPTDLLARSGTPTPLLVPPEERAFWELGIAWRIVQTLGHTEPTEEELVISDRQEAVRVLHRLVDAVWHDLHGVFQQFDRESVIRAALENAEEIQRDRLWWRRTARALTSIPVIQDDVARVARLREGARATAATASRTIVEMAICESPNVGGRPISKAELGSLTAGAAILLQMASEADAIAGGPPALAVRIQPNGFVDVEQPWLDEVAAPYTRASFEADLRNAVARYAEHVAQPQGRPRRDKRHAADATVPDVDRTSGVQNPVSASNDVANAQSDDARSEDRNGATPYDESTFVRAFGAEYGITPRKLIEATAECIDWGVERKQPVFTIRRGELAARLMDRRHFTPEEVDALLHSFALVPRPRWDEAPHGFRDPDWYPWRFRRRLSLIARPFIQLDDTDERKGGSTLDRTLFIVSIDQCEASLSYILDGLHRGWFQQEFVTTPEMRSYLGEAARQRGAAFTQRVAEVCRSAGWQARTDVPMTQLGAAAELGDVDVLAWKSGDRQLLCIECKQLRPARTVAEILEVLTHFRGDAKDRLGVHMARFSWIREHLQDAERGVRASLVGLEVVPLLVTSAVVPMQFVSDLPLAVDQIMPLDALPQVLRTTLVDRNRA